MSEEMRDLYSHVALGMEAEAFIQGAIGQHMISKAEAEIEAALDELKRIDPTDAKAIRDLQNSIYRAESIQYWLAEAIQTGINAQRELTEE